MCFSGLRVIDLYFYNTTSSNALPTSLLFTYSGQNINGLIYSNIYGCNISTICLGACPPGSYFYSSNSSGGSCLPCSNLTCRQCSEGYSLIQVNNSYSCQLIEASSSSSSTIPIAIIVPAVVAGILFLLLFVFLCKKRYSTSVEAVPDSNLRLGSQQ